MKNKLERLETDPRIHPNPPAIIESYQQNSRLAERLQQNIDQLKSSSISGASESIVPVTYELYAIPPPLDNKVALFELQSKINTLESKIVTLESFVPEIQEIATKMEKIESDAARKINMRRIESISLDKQAAIHVDELYKYFSEVGGYVKQLPPLVKRLKVYFQL